VTTVEDRVKEVIIDRVGLPIKDSSRLSEDLTFDSLDNVCLVMELEEEFDIEIPDQDPLDFRTVKDVVDYIKRRMK
jgi:acyl carrier protein